MAVLSQDVIRAVVAGSMKTPRDQSNRAFSKSLEGTGKLALRKLKEGI